MGDLAVEMLRRGYLALPHWWESEGNQGDHGEGRLLGRRALVVRGPEGARLLYDDTLIERQGAIPRPLAGLLFGRGAVHGLDDEEHRERKGLFLDVLRRPGRVEVLGDHVARELHDSIASWPTRTPVSLFDELVRVYAMCVLPWAGVKVEPGEAAQIGRRLAWIVDGFGFAPGAYARAWWARGSADRWATRMVREARSGRRSPAEGTMLQALATGAGSRLPARVAGVELLNVLRPTVAVAWLGVFAAVALVRHPEYGAELAEPAARRARWDFADEVRRTAPFVPALTGRVRRTATWQGVELHPGDLVVLDVPGTDHHSSTWSDPDRFRPGRFDERTPDPFQHVPQGGGDPAEGHRCPGEPVTMTLLDRTLQQLASLRFTVDTSEPDLRRVPTRPGGGVLLTDVELLDGGLDREPEDR